MKAATQRNDHGHGVWVLVWLAVAAVLVVLLSGCTPMMESGYSQRSVVSPITPTATADATLHDSARTRLAPGEELWVIAKPAQPETQPIRPCGLYRLAPGDEQQPIEMRLSPLPLERTSIEARIDGLIASVKYEQAFTNPYATKIEVVYVFPLPGDSAVTGFVMNIGERRIRGVVRPLEEAKQLYEQAKSQGLQASLLTQESLDLFTQRVANIEPGKTIGVELTYFQTLSPDDGEYTFTLPLTAPHRYDPSGTAAQAKAFTSRSPRFDLTLDLLPGVAVQNLRSPTHAVVVESQHAGRHRITLDSRSNSTPTDRDFVLRYTLDHAQAETKLWTHRDDKTGRSYFAVMVCPPGVSEGLNADAEPIDLVMLLDVSGSVRGRPMEQLQQAALSAIEHLGPNDTLQIVAFNDRTHQLFDAPQLAVFAHRQQARSFVRSLESLGGTQMLPALQQALTQPRRPGTRRLVALLSDGLVTNDQAILDELAAGNDDTRVFAFGIGSAPNHALLASVAQRSHGAAAALAPADEASHAAAMMTRFFERARGPVFSELVLKTDGSSAITTHPQPMPALLPGRPVLITGSVGTGVSMPSRFEVLARNGGLSHTFAVDSADAQDCPALPKVVARQELQSMQRMLNDAHVNDYAALVNTLIERSEQSQLVTPYTAFVSVDATRRTEGDFGSTVDVPLTTPQ